MNCGTCGTPDCDSDPPSDSGVAAAAAAADGPKSERTSCHSRRRLSRRRQKLTKVNSLLQAVGRQLHQETEAVRVEPGIWPQSVEGGEDEEVDGFGGSGVKFRHCRGKNVATQKETV